MCACFVVVDGDTSHRPINSEAQWTAALRLHKEESFMPRGDNSQSVWGTAAIPIQSSIG